MSSTSVLSVPAYTTGDKIGFIGLGRMGSAMATNLALSLPHLDHPRPPLVLFNRSQSKAQAVKAEIESRGGQAEVASDLSEVAQKCHTIFTCLSDDAAVLSVYDQLSKADVQLRQTSTHPGEDVHTIWVDLSTVSPSTTGTIELQVSSQPRRHFMAAPAIGLPDDAKTQKLVFATAGAARSKQAIRPLLVPAMGKRCIDLGGNHEMASTFKLITNSFMLGAIELLGETMTLADKTEVGASKFVEFLQSFASESPMLLSYADRILHSDFRGENGFSLEGGITDASHIRELGSSADCPLSIVDAANQHMIAARANAPPHSNLDWSALVAGQRMTAGLDAWKGKRPGLKRD